MTETQRAFKAWMDTFPRNSIPNPTTYLHKANHQVYRIPQTYSGDCPCPGGSSYHMTAIEKKWGNNIFYEAIKRPDNEVCPRERAWRRYVLLRDGKH